MSVNTIRDSYTLYVSATAGHYGGKRRHRQHFYVNLTDPIEAASVFRMFSVQGVAASLTQLSVHDLVVVAESIDGEEVPSRTFDLHAVHNDRDFFRYCPTSHVQKMLEWYGPGRNKPGFQIHMDDFRIRTVLR